MEVIDAYSVIKNSSDALLQGYNDFIKGVLIENVKEHGCIKLEGPWHRKFQHAAVNCAAGDDRLYEGQRKTIQGAHKPLKGWYYGSPFYNTLTDPALEASQRRAFAALEGMIQENGDLEFDGNLYEKMQMDVLDQGRLILNVSVSIDGVQKELTITSGAPYSFVPPSLLPPLPVTDDMQVERAWIRRMILRRSTTTSSRRCSRSM